MTGLADADALERLLSHAVRRPEPRVLALRLLERFGTLAGVMDASYAALTEVPGLTGHTATLLKLVPQMARKTAVRRAEREVQSVQTREQAAQLLGPRFVGQTAEVVCALLVSGTGRVLDCRQISRGAERFAGIDARRVADAAFDCGAKALYLAHNHPRGLARPSRQDRAVTERLSAALRSLNVTILGHCVFADDEYIWI